MVYSSTETSSMFPRAENHANGSSIDHPDGEIGEDGHYYKCVICDDGGDLLCCDTCPGVYHLQCLDPPLEHVPAGSWQCQRCCQKDVMVRPVKSLKSWRRPESSDNTMEELDAAEVLANKMSISRSCDKNLPDKGLGTDIIQSRRWKGKYFSRRSGVKRRRCDKSGLFNSSSTQSGSDKKVDAFLKKDVPCSDRQEEKAADVDSDGLIDAPQALETVRNVVSSDRRNNLVDVWSEEELDALWVGVRRHGPGNWQMMLEDPILKFSTSKTPQDLSLRWEIERQRILNNESFQASPYQVSRTRGVLKIYYKPRKPSTSSQTNDSSPAAESEPSLKDWCTKEEGCSEETVSGGDGDNILTD